ncbi:hypothetical protein CEY02_01050 [Bacillus pumilus]|uniref:Uncharacterized protein n=1 Tax=Bacillus pumilus TaxID=1408 RepID=A0A2A5J1R4_BACPU|nr:hypothetical protein CEY02_01050 [Bacillus pumilus]
MRSGFKPFEHKDPPLVDVRLTEEKVRDLPLILYFFRDKRMDSAFFCTPIISEGGGVYDEAFVIIL